MKENEGKGFYADRVVIHGVGLLGASLGLALKKRHMAGEILGVGRNPEKLEKAVQQGAIDRYSLDLPEAALGADLVVLCGPVRLIPQQLPEVLEKVPDRCLVTDVGSTKASIVAAAKNPPGKLGFIGSHPMAGSEKSGAQHGWAELYQGAKVVLTPDANTRPEALGCAEALWRGLGCRTLQMDPQAHDVLLSRLSHLPHLVTSALARMTGLPDTHPLWPDVAGGGFRDATRIAIANATMWLDIYGDNRQALLHDLDQYMAFVQELRDQIANEDEEGLRAFLEAGTRQRLKLEKPK